MSGQPVRLYTWPTSQICLECIHGKLAVIGIPFSSSQEMSYVCMENCGDNDGVNCSKQEKEK